MQTFQKDHPLKNEDITVMLKPNYRKKFYPVHAKYRALQKEGEETKEIFVYLNGLGIQTMGYGEYIDMCNQLKPGDRLDKLNAEVFNFEAEIINSNEHMHSEKEIGLTHHGLTLKGNDPKTIAKKIFWLNNPKVEINGEPNGNDTIFEVTVLGALKQKKMVDLKGELEISNFVNGIQDERTLTDIFYYFGLNPEGKNKDDMKLALLRGDTIAQSDGNKIEIGAILMNVKNAADFRRTFMDDSNPARKMILGINKAKHHNIITMTNIQGNRGWYYNESFLGTEDSELQMYFTSKPAIFDAVLSKIERIEKNKYPKEHKDLIPPAAKMDDINEKTNLIQELFDLVRKNQVVIPDDVVVTKLNVSELKEYINSKKVEKHKEKEEEPEEESTDLIVFKRKSEDEENRSYRFRILGVLSELVDNNKITLPEGTILKSLKVVDIEAHLIAYEKTINPAK